MSYETDRVDLIQGEIIPVDIDAAPVLEDADTIQAVEVKVIEVTTKAEITGAVQTRIPPFTDQTLHLTLDGTTLRANDVYRLISLVIVEPSEKEVGIVTPLACVT